MKAGTRIIYNPFIYSNLDLGKNHEDCECTAKTGISISYVEEDVFSAADKAQLTLIDKVST